jgi:hypothetical protein
MGPSEFREGFVYCGEVAPSQSELAFEWLSDAPNRRRWRPEDVLCDAWSPSRALLKRMRNKGWSFVCRLTKNRRFNAQPRRTSRRPPSWAMCGWRSEGLKGLVVRYCKENSATKRLILSAAEGRRRYRVRSQSAEVSRVGQD